MILASIFEPQLLLPRVMVLLRDCSPFHFLAGLELLPLHLQLVHLLFLRGPLLVLILLVLHQFLEDMRLLQLVGLDLLL